MLPDAGEDLLQDRLRILGSRIVRCHNRQVAVAGGDLAHNRPLAAVTVAAATEYRNNATGIQPADRLQNILQSIAGVGIIDQDQSVAIILYFFDPARDDRDLCNPLEDGLMRNLQGDSRGDRTKDIADTELAEQF